MSAQGGPTPAGAGQLRNPYKSYLNPTMGDLIDITFYTTQVTLTAGQSLPTTINIDAGNDFYWFASTYEADVAGVSFDATTNQRVYPLINVVITDSGSQRQLMNAAVPLPTIAGDGNLPYRLLLPRMFQANSIIQFAWTSFEATRADTIRFVMHGWRMPKGTNFANTGIG